MKAPELARAMQAQGFDATVEVNGMECVVTGHFNAGLNGRLAIQMAVSRIAPGAQEIGNAWSRGEVRKQDCYLVRFDCEGRKWSK